MILHISYTCVAEEIDAAAAMRPALLQQGQLELAQVVADEAAAEALAADEPGA